MIFLQNLSKAGFVFAVSSSFFLYIYILLLISHTCSLMNAKECKQIESLFCFHQIHVMTCLKVFSILKSVLICLSAGNSFLIATALLLTFKEYTLVPDESARCYADIWISFFCPSIKWPLTTVYQMRIYFVFHCILSLTPLVSSYSLNVTRW